MEQFNKMKGVAVVIGLGALWISLSAGAATTASTEFSATIAYEGACDITTPATVIFNSGDPVLPSQIEAGNAVVNQTFNVTLVNCQGIGVTPKITLIGVPNTDTGKALFADAVTSSTAATGYGILLSTKGNSNFAANENLAAVKTICSNQQLEHKHQFNHHQWGYSDGGNTQLWQL